MSFLNGFFKKKEKKPSAKCTISNTLLEYGEGYALTTAQIISSKSFWDHKMLEPETLSYTTSHFKDKDPMATQMRGLIFEKYAEKKEPWLICESYIHLFDVDQEKSQEYAKEWWSTGGMFAPPGSGTASGNMDSTAYNEIKEYATMSAGQERV